MPTIREQFTYQEIPNHFERDTHIAIQHIEIDQIKVLYGETAQEDILVVLYKDSPILSFYDTGGHLVDIDHYLPEDYRKQDVLGAESVMANLKNLNLTLAKNRKQYKAFLEETFIVGEGDLGTGLKRKFGLETSERAVLRYQQVIGFAGERVDFELFLIQHYKSFYEFLEDFIVSQQQGGSGYVHITPKDNIIITPLNKRSGVAVMIETQDLDGKLLAPSKWVITRTNEVIKFEQALVFRTPDIQAFFNTDGFETTFETDRYKLFHNPDRISIDSLVDNTDNLLRVDLVNDCYQVLASDQCIIVSLSGEREITIVNTHRSVVPHKWPHKISLPVAGQWMRVDENLSLLFLQTETGEVIVYDITGNYPEEVARLGIFTHKFEIDQNGHLLFRASYSNELLKIKTNVLDLELPADQKNFTTVFKNLSYLFKGESLFTETQFAKVVTKESAPAPEKLPSAIEIARYDFETNIEHRLANVGSDYGQLLEIQNKIAIARQNITEKLTDYAEQEGIFLVGQRLQTTINSIVRPTEKKVRNLVEETRAGIILETLKNYKEQVNNLSDPNAYREILNTIRKFEDELRVMLPENKEAVLSEFKTIQQELNALFSDQIASDDATLQRFIIGEIEQIEQAIDNTHDPRQLEILLSVHPAALELMSLLKQSFILRNIAKEKNLSPAGIQSRLYEAVANRKAILEKEVAKQEAEKNAAKLQLANMITESINFFVFNHSGGFSDLELSANATHQQILRDIAKLEKNFADMRLSTDLRRRLERKILERNRADLEKMVAYEGKYAFVQNDPDLFVDLESSMHTFPEWDISLMEKKGVLDAYLVSFIRNTDKEVYRPSTTENLRSGKSFELTAADYQDFFGAYEKYSSKENSYELLQAVWTIYTKEKTVEQFPQFNPHRLNNLRPETEVAKKGLRCALEKKWREHIERTRKRNIPTISADFIDETPYFQAKLREFIIKAKLQLVTGSGVILLSGPPSTGKSVFLQFAASVMNREYFEHASDKWQTKNSLVTTIKFGEHGPFSIPAGFTKAITTPHSLINIEEIKEWPEALRKSLNPFFAGSKVFLAPDGTPYKIGENILLCAAANLGAIYRQEDEPFTADFWSRIEVVEYDYAPQAVDRQYYESLYQAKKNKLLSTQDLVREYFGYRAAPRDPQQRAMYFSQQFLEFILLPKADEKVKKENLSMYIRDYFLNEANLDTFDFSPEEAAKVSLRRLKDFQGYTPLEFFTLYDHFNNGQPLRNKRLAKLQTSDIQKYEHLRVLLLSIRYMEGCLRKLRDLFYSSAGRTEIEGTNREFIKCVQLLGLLGRV